MEALRLKKVWIAGVGALALTATGVWGTAQAQSPWGESKGTDSKNTDAKEAKETDAPKPAKKAAKAEPGESDEPAKKSAKAVITESAEKSEETEAPKSSKRKKRKKVSAAAGTVHHPEPPVTEKRVQVYRPDPVPPPAPFGTHAEPNDPPATRAEVAPPLPPRTLGDAGEHSTAESKGGVNEGSEMITPSGKTNVNEFTLKTEAGCFNVEFQETPGSTISCTEWLPVKYKQRNCSNSEQLEVGKVQASVSCEKNRLYHVTFRTSKDTIRATLRVKRVTEGRSGSVNHYLVVDESSAPDPKESRPLPSAEVLPANEKAPEESPLTTKVSGFAYAEGEWLSHYGSSAQNFSKERIRTGKTDVTFMSNLGIEFAKDRTHLNTLFEIGEIYYGEGTTPDAVGGSGTANSSGGGQGGRGRIVEVRNIYLTHEYSEKLSFKTGLLTIASDPRGLVFNDQIAAGQIDYKSDLSDGMIWVGKANAASNRNNGGFNSANTAGKNYFAGFSGTLSPLSAIKANLFGLARFSNTQEWIAPDGSGASIVPTTNTYWLGANVQYDLNDAVNFQLAGIGDSVHAKSGDFKQSHNAFLADAKLSYTNPHSSFGVSLEGLMTPGRSGSTAANANGDDRPIMGQSRGFSSVTDTAYLTTLATSDGLDDAVGAFRSSGLVAPLSQPEGLRIGVLTTSMTFTKRTSGLLRYGVFSTAHAVGDTGSKELGREADAMVLHQLNPSTQLQLDGAMLWPGAAEGAAHQATATLVAGKMKFSF